MRILYVPTQRSASPADLPSSDSIGYGVTSSAEIVTGLRSIGCEVEVLGQAPQHRSPEAWSDRHLYPATDVVGLATRAAELKPDAVFLFHSFATPAALVRKSLLEANLQIPIVGYLHGSHWDETDTFRDLRYPGLRWLDLANISTLDAALVVSDSFLNQLREALSCLPSAFRPDIEDRLVKIPLPVATGLMDLHQIARTVGVAGSARVTFNHAPIEGKRPDIFANVMLSVMDEFPDVTCLFTRRIRPGDFGAEAVSELRRRFPSRVELGGDLAIADYYHKLWQSDLQVSTATHETLGVSTLEAMYAGNCCVLPDLPAYIEITGGYPGVTYPQTDRGLYNSLASHIQNPNNSYKMGERMRIAAMKYSPSNVVSEIAQILERVVVSSRSKSPA